MTAGSARPSTWLATGSGKASTDTSIGPCRSGSGPDLHSPRPAGAIPPWLVGRADASRRQRVALRAPPHAGPRLPRRQMTAWALMTVRSPDAAVRPFEEVVAEHGPVVMRVC